MRPIEALQMPDAKPAEITTSPPIMRMVPPASLFVDETYQRGLSDRSVRLIRKIVDQWDWRAFKPPVVVDVDGKLQVIDGQHTAIGAVTHGGIAEIPVLVIEADAIAARANAFVRHNRDRIQVTPTQLHSAMVAAGDEDAKTVAQVCERAGVHVLRNPPAFGKFKSGDTLAIVTLRELVNRRFAAGARRVLDICVKTGVAPISADLIKGVEHLLYAPEYKDEIDDTRIVQVLSAHASTVDQEASRFAAERKVPRWRALASVVFMNRRKVRNAA